LGGLLEFFKPLKERAIFVTLWFSELEFKKKEKMKGEEKYKNKN
jgi:hypothetical protein